MSDDRDRPLLPDEIATLHQSPWLPFETRGAAVTGQCERCGGWHTQPTACPANQPATISPLCNAAASFPMQDWRDAEIDRLRRERDGWKNEAMLMAAHQGIDNYDRLRRELEEAQRQRDELLDFAETVASGKQGDCGCWVCELGRMAQEAIDAARESSHVG